MVYFVLKIDWNRPSDLTCWRSTAVHKGHGAHLEQPRGVIPLTADQEPAWPVQRKTLYRSCTSTPGTRLLPLLPGQEHLSHRVKRQQPRDAEGSRWEIDGTAERRESCSRSPAERRCSERSRSSRRLLKWPLFYRAAAAPATRFSPVLRVQHCLALERAQTSCCGSSAALRNSFKAPQVPVMSLHAALGLLHADNQTNNQSEQKNPITN